MTSEKWNFSVMCSHSNKISSVVREAVIKKKSKCKLFPNWPWPPPPSKCKLFSKSFLSIFFQLKTLFSVLKTYFKQSFHTRCPFWNLKFSKIQNLKNVNFGVAPPPFFGKSLQFELFFYGFPYVPLQVPTTNTNTI